MPAKVWNLTAGANWPLNVMSTKVNGNIFLMMSAIQIKLLVMANMVIGDQSNLPAMMQSFFVTILLHCEAIPWSLYL